MKLSLSKKSIDAIPLPLVGQALYYDTVLPGFGLRATKTTKTFFAEGSVKGSGRKRYTIGRYGLITPEQGRSEARQVLARMARGEDPDANKGGVRTLAEVWEDVKGIRTSGQGKQLKKKTLDGYTWIIDVVFADDYKHKPIKYFTEQKIRELHKQFTLERGPTIANNAMAWLRMLFNVAIWFYSDMREMRNPVESLGQQGLWNPKRRRRGYIPTDRIATWVAKAELLDGVQRGAILMLLFLGIRREECYNLKKTDITEAGIVVRDTKNGIQHTAPMGPYLWARIEPLLKSEGPWLFPSNRSKTGHIVDCRKALAVLGEKVSPHDLRRTFVSALNGLEPPPSQYTIKRLMNHYKDWDDVTAGYIQHEEKKLREVITRLEAEMLKQPGPQDL